MNILGIFIKKYDFKIQLLSTIGLKINWVVTVILKNYIFVLDSEYSKECIDFTTMFIFFLC